MIYKKLIELGCEHQAFSVSNRIKTTNIVSLITFIISALYTLNYIFVLNHKLVAVINTVFTLCYLLPLVFNYYHGKLYANISFFVILMTHLFICTNLYVTNETGFHLYYFLVPTGVYLLFELHEKRIKILLSLIATILFFICQNTPNLSPLIALTTQENNLIYQSVILVNMIEVIIVLTIFTNQIEINETKLTLQATTDSLTGISNRHHFFEQGNILIAKTKKARRPVSLLLLDIDNFKTVNDRYGHAAGDTCLKSTCAELNKQLSEDDILARVGGEEFAVILFDTTLNEAKNIAEKLRLSINNLVITHNHDVQFSCTASFGISTLSDKNSDLKSLLVKADKALYQAKESGRNRVIPYSVAGAQS